MFLAEFFTVAVLHLLAVMSLGPDFIMVSRNSLLHSRRIGVLSAFGAALGVLLHVTYSLIGIGYVISQSIVLFSTLKLLSAAYLVYIGFQCLRAKPAAAGAGQHGDAAHHAPAGQGKKPLTPGGAIRMGFLTEATNPKATLFFFAVFTQVINVHTPKLVQVLYGLEMSAATFLWFATVATVVSHDVVRTKFNAVQHRMEHVFGVLLVALGIKVALSRK